MGKTHLISASKWSAIVVLITAGSSHLSWADPATAMPAPTSAAGVTSPTAFNGDISNSGTLFNGSTCNAIQNAAVQGLDTIASMFTGRSASCARPTIPATIPLDYQCPGSESGPSAESLTCQSLGGAGGVPTEAALCAKTQAVANALAHIQCQKSKASAVQAELQCLTADAGRLAQQVTSIQSAYQQNIQRMEQDMQKIEGLLTDRQAQLGLIAERLGGQGEGGNGATGLLALQAQLEAATTGGGGENGGGGIDSQVTRLQNQMHIAEQARRAFDEQVSNRTMELSSECFSRRTSPEYRCKPNGPPVSAREYVLCRYEQSQRLDDQGQFNASKQSAEQAQANRAGLESVLSQIFDDTPQAAPQSANGQAPAGGSRAALITTADDVERLYGDQLAQYNGSLNIQAFVNKSIRSCFQRASKIVETEKTKASSPLSQTRTQMETAQNDLRSQANTMLEAGAQLLSKGREALTGKNLPVSTSGCKDAEPSVQISCLQNLKRDMGTLLKGDNNAAAISMEFRASDANNRVEIKCFGINGCIADLRNMDRNMRTEIQRVNAFKGSYVTQARQTTEAFTRQMSSMMSTQSRALKDRLQRLNGILTTQLHASQGIDIPSVQAEQMQYGENGLPQVPQNVMALIGGATNPPMLDVSGDNFSSSLGSVQEALQRYDEPAADLNAAQNRLATLQSECREERLAALATQADTLANCGNDHDFCSSGGPSRLQELQRSLSSLNLDSSSAMTSIDSTLSAGVSSCGRSSQRRTANNARLEALRSCSASDFTADAAVTTRGRTGPCNGKTVAQVSSDISTLENAGTVATGDAPPSNCFSVVSNLRRQVERLGGSSSSEGSSGSAHGGDE